MDQSRGLQVEHRAAGMHALISRMKEDFPILPDTDPWEQYFPPAQSTTAKRV